MDRKANPRVCLTSNARKSVTMNSIRPHQIIGLVSQIIYAFSPFSSQNLKISVEQEDVKRFFIGGLLDFGN